MNRLEPQQIEKLQEISTQLRQQRESQDITLEQLAARTYIPLRALRALDAGQVEQLPEPIFVQGFIRRYGEAVGLNGVTLAQQFPTEIAPPPSPPEEPEPQAQAENKLAIALGDWQKPAAIAVGAFVGLGLLGWGLTALLTSRKPAAVTRTQPSPVSQPSPSTTQPAAPVAARPSPKPAAKTAPVEAAVKVTQEAWVQVTVDGKSAFEGTLAPGTQQTWTAQRQITLLTGNAGGVNVAVNRGAAKPLGEVGQVKEVSLTPQTSSTPTSPL